MKSETRPEITGSKPASPSDDSADLVWGAKNIGREIDRSLSQVYYLHGVGALEGAVTKLGHKTIVGSRKRLNNLLGLNSKKQISKTA